MRVIKYRGRNRITMNQPMSVCIQLNSLHINLSDGERERLYAVAIVNSAMAFPTAALNGLVIFAILFTRTLSTPSYFLLANLACTDLLVGLVSQPLLSALTLYYRDGNMEKYCYFRSIAAVIFATGSGASVMTVTAIAADRYLAIRLKIKYKSTVTVRRVKCVLVFIWVLGSLLSALPFFSPPITAGIIGASGVAFCLSITVMCYVMLFIALKKHCAQIIPQESQQPNISNQAIDIVKYKKLLKTMLIVLAFIVFCYTFMAGALGVITKSEESRSTLWLLTSIVGLNSTFNPVIYICRMRDLRQACLRILRKYFTFLKI